MKKIDKGIGIWQILKDPTITDIIANAGFDLTILDLEHGQHTIDSIQNCVYAAKASSISTIVRVPEIKYQNLIQLIDVGVDGLLFPHVETNEQIVQIINQCLLPPNGKKSYSPFVPKYSFGKTEISFNRNPLVGILIESECALLDIDNLLSNPFVDFIYFGAYDLSVEFGMPGEIFSEKVKESLILLNKKAKSHGKKVFSIYRNNKELDYLKSLSIEFPIASVDTFHILEKLKKEVEIYNSFT